MFDHLKSLGISHPEEVDRYSVREEANNDILKIYFRKVKGEFFAKSAKFKFSRDHREGQENLQDILKELEEVCQQDHLEIDLKNKILEDLRHLESVVSNKIAEIESDLERLTRK